MKYAKPLLVLFAIGFSFLLGFGLGIFKTQGELIRSSNSSGLMFVTGIHEHLVEGDYEGAKKITEGAATCYILSIDNLEQHALFHCYWSLFPWIEKPDMKAFSARYLNRAFDHFSKYPKALPPEAMTYLEKFKEAKSQPGPSN